jgi:RNA polymerase sigma-70 factor (ECF subfamily)
MIRWWQPPLEDIMPNSNTDGLSSYAVPAAFQTTHWSVVMAAGVGATPQSTYALERLCDVYWYPIYSYLRRQNHARHDAQDLTQAFFAHLLANERLRQVHPAKGKFRSFLLASLRHFLANEWDKRQTLKRGGQFKLVSLDEQMAEERFHHEPSHAETPDKAFEQTWAMTVLDAVFAGLRQEYTTDGKAGLFDALRTYLSGDKGVVPYAETAAKFGLSEGAVKMAVLRMRRRFGELLRAEIARTVSRPEEIDEEIRCLFAAVSA